MSLTRVIVFRFDRDPLVCRGRIRLLRRYNPGVPIFGLYGGPGGYRRAVFALFGRRALGLDHLFVSPQLGRWNWRNGDLALAEWFRRVGHAIDFDVVHVIEWDLLILESLEKLYAHVPPKAVGLTTVTPLRHVESDWEWLTRPGGREEWERLLDHARQRWGYDADPKVCLAGGACLPRSFIENYARAPLPMLCNDEIRMPLFAQAHGFPIVETGFGVSWRSSNEDPFFNVGGANVESDAILAELADPSGRRVFHPVRTAWRFPWWPKRRRGERGAGPITKTWGYLAPTWITSLGLLGEGNQSVWLGLV